VLDQVLAGQHVDLLKVVRSFLNCYQQVVPVTIVLY
jgi:hypothetical protein